MEDKTLKVYIKNVYGKQMIYPLCKRAQILCQNTGRSTFGEFYPTYVMGNLSMNMNNQLAWINQIGFDVVLGHEFEKVQL